MTEFKYKDKEGYGVKIEAPSEQIADKKAEKLKLKKDKHYVKYSL